MKIPYSPKESEYEYPNNIFEHLNFRGIRTEIAEKLFKENIGDLNENNFNNYILPILTNRERLVLKLRFKDKITVEEIGTIIGLTPASSRVIIEDAELEILNYIIRTQTDFYELKYNYPNNIFESMKCCEFTPHKYVCEDPRKIVLHKSIEKDFKGAIKEFEKFLSSILTETELDFIHLRFRDKMSLNDIETNLGIPHGKSLDILNITTRKIFISMSKRRFTYMVCR